MNIATITTSASRTDIDAERVPGHYAQLAEIGRMVKDGMDRQALRDSDKDVHAPVLRWFNSKRYNTFEGVVGHNFITRTGSETRSTISSSDLDERGGENFSLLTMGSAVFAGRFAPKLALESTHRNRKSLAEQVPPRCKPATKAQDRW